MSSNGRFWLVAFCAALVGVVLGAGIVWATQRSSSASLNAQLITSQAQKDAAQRTIDELKSSSGAPSVPESTVAVPSPSASQTAAPTPAPPAVKSTKQLAFITAVDPSGQVPTIVADYAQMLTGDAAAAAATERGDESPPPNDYYIVNDSKLLRHLKVRPGISVELTSLEDGTSDASGHMVTFAEWASSFTEPRAENEGIRTAPYWITVKSGVVTKIVQQYLP